MATPKLSATPRPLMVVAGPTAIGTAVPWPDIALTLSVLAGFALILWLVWAERLRLVEVRRAHPSDRRSADGGVSIAGHAPHRDRQPVRDGGICRRTASIERHA